MIIDAGDLVKDRNVFFFLVYPHLLDAFDLFQFHLNDDNEADDTTIRK